MFEDIIGTPEKQWPSADKIFEICSTCIHSKLRPDHKNTPRIHCTIGAGMKCANNLDSPFNMWKSDIWF
jgi:hypothetical protein